jgi:hypothetical protein
MVRYHNSGTQKFDDTEHDSVSTGNIVDTDDGKAWETLNETGLDQGDFVPIGPAGTLPTWAHVFTTSSAGFSSSNDYANISTVWDEWLPSGATGAIRTQLKRDGGGTGTVRLRNITDSESVWSVSSGSLDNPIIRTDSYTPPTTSSEILFRVDAESTDGGGIILRDYSFQFGVIL